MELVFTILSKLNMGKKFVAMLVGLLLAALKAAHPDWPLPSEQLVQDLVLAFMAAHSLTDIAAVLKVGAKEVAKEIAPKL